jgi:hypothetical protein
MQKKTSKIVFIIIEILWLLMGAFTTYAGFRVMKNNPDYDWMAWVYFVIAILCFLMFLLRYNTRKKNRRK